MVRLLHYRIYGWKTLRNYRNDRKIKQNPLRKKALLKTLHLNKFCLLQIHQLLPPASVVFVDVGYLKFQDILPCEGKQLKQEDWQLLQGGFNHSWMLAHWCSGKPHSSGFEYFHDQELFGLMLTKN